MLRKDKFPNIKHTKRQNFVFIIRIFLLLSEKNWSNISDGRIILLHHINITKKLSHFAFKYSENCQFQKYNYDLYMCNLNMDKKGFLLNLRTLS